MEYSNESETESSPTVDLESASATNWTVLSWSKDRIQDTGCDVGYHIVGYDTGYDIVTGLFFVPSWKIKPVPPASFTLLKCQTVRYSSFLFELTSALLYLSGAHEKKCVLQLAGADL
ncbi:hypothetical protein ACMFMG_005573 [Clarireedia jacksonii]